MGFFNTLKIYYLLENKTNLIFSNKNGYNDFDNNFDVQTAVLLSQIFFSNL